MFNKKTDDKDLKEQMEDYDKKISGAGRPSLPLDLGSGGTMGSYRSGSSSSLQPGGAFKNYLPTDERAKKGNKFSSFYTGGGGNSGGSGGGGFGAGGFSLPHNNNSSSFGSSKARNSDSGYSSNSSSGQRRNSFSSLGSSGSLASPLGSPLGSPGFGFGNNNNNNNNRRGGRSMSECSGTSNSSSIGNSNLHTLWENEFGKKKKK